MIALLQAAFLGIIQGLTEFIPVSSSGHLVLWPKFLGWSDPGLAFDVALHIGTLLAVLIYFRHDWIEVIKGFFTSLTVKPSKWDRPQRLAWLIILATVPAAIAGVLLSGFFEDNLRSLGSVALFLAAGSIIMAAADLYGRKQRSFEQVGTGDAVAMGLMQVVALAPGMSRSGATMSGGLFNGLDRDAAARFSFMMSAPVIAGAGLVEVVKVARDGLGGSTAAMVVTGFVTSAVVGFFTIKYLLVYLKRHTLMPFVIYGLVLSSAILLLIILT